MPHLSHGENRRSMSGIRRAGRVPVSMHSDNPGVRLRSTSVAMKTNPLNPLFAAAAIAAVLSAPMQAQDAPKPADPPAQSTEPMPERRADLIKELENAMDAANPVQIERVERALRERMLNRGIEPRAGLRGLQAPGSPWKIGVMAEPAPPILRTHLNLPADAGLLVTRVSEGSPAAKAGISPNDVILAAGDRKLENLQNLKDAVHAAGRDDKPLNLTVIHEGKRRELKLQPLGPKPEKAPETAKAGAPDRPDAAARMLAEQNRRMNEMRGEIQDLRRRIDQQQKEIRSLHEKLKTREPKNTHEEAAPAENGH